MNFFDQYPEFVECDARKEREIGRVTTETLYTRHKASLPKEILEGKTVLDLGSCYGASGQWVLGHGCKHYTGVEIQDEMAKTSERLLSKYWTPDCFKIVQQDVRQFLKEQITSGKKYDVLIVIGIVYAFLDTYEFLKDITSVAKEVIVIDSITPWSMSTPTHSMIEISKNQTINSTEIDLVFKGAGALPSQAAMITLMETLGYNCPEGTIFPDPLTDKSVHDSYNDLMPKRFVNQSLPIRYLLRFYKGVTSDIVEVGKLISSAEPNAPRVNLPQFRNVEKAWEFDESVAKRFQLEAETHIPDYQRVINYCLWYTRCVYKDRKDINIIDVGSALGHTMNTFISDGYPNVYGVENSLAMKNNSKFPDRVILNDKFPKGKIYDVILANWTLHFIKDRENYIRDMANSLAPGGLMIISDKMQFSVESEYLYHGFKKFKGVSEAEIETKKASLQGVLTPLPLQWYLELLKSIGMNDIQVINASYMFNTIYCRKY